MIDMSNPHISVITITYNSEKTLEKTIQSVLSQKYDNLEYIIIDGGSKDGTLNIINKYRDKIAVVVSEPDNGISDAFNKGIKYATGEIIGIINSDDLLMPGALKAIVDCYSPEIDVYRGRLLINNPHTGFKYSSGKPTLYCPVTSYLKLNVCHPSTFVTKRAYNKVGGYKVYLKYIMDMDMLFRLTSANCSFAYVPYDLAQFNLGGVSGCVFYKRIYERYRVVRENDGSFIFGFYVATRCMVKDIVKLMMDKLFGEDFKNALLRRKNLSDDKSN